MTQIEITFLGTTAGIPTKSRNHAALYIRYQSENEFCMLFDCGEGTQKQIFTAGLNFMRIDNIFITHWHADHFAGLLGLLETMRSEEHTSELQSQFHLVCRLLLEKKKEIHTRAHRPVGRPRRHLRGSRRWPA